MRIPYAFRAYYWRRIFDKAYYCRIIAVLAGFSFLLGADRVFGQIFVGSVCCQDTSIIRPSAFLSDLNMGTV